MNLSLNNKYLILIVICLGLSSSCTKDFEEINQNPFFPTQTDIGPLFNTLVNSLREDLDFLKSAQLTGKEWADHLLLLFQRRTIILISRAIM